MLEYPKSPSPQERSIIYTPRIIILWGNLWILTEELCDFAPLCACPSGKGCLAAVVLSFCCGPNATHPRTHSNVLVLECHHIHKCAQKAGFYLWRFRWSPWNPPFFPLYHFRNQWVNWSGTYTHSHSCVRKRALRGVMMVSIKVWQPNKELLLSFLYFVAQKTVQIRFNTHQGST